MEEIIINTNKYQTPVTKELLNLYPPEIQEQLLDYLSNVPFIQNLISPDRPYAKDLPRDNKGRIIVDITKPHILTNMDYFRESAIHFEKYGCYTFLKPNPNPNSEFGKWFKRELNRLWDGCIREEDGEWITGELYYYMNYTPIMLSKIDEDNPNIADRVEGFPETWEGIYWRFHYIHQARNGGIHNNFKGGNHCAELAKRGCSKSFSLASMMARRLLLGENSKNKRRVTTVLAAYIREYLAEKDGTISKFIPIIDHAAQYTQFPRARLKDALQDMIWQMGYKDLNTGVNKGSLNTVMGISVNEVIGKLRGKRGFIYIEEFGSFKNLLQVYATLRPSVEEGDIVFGLIYLVGTSGDSESDFEAAQEMMYHPDGYNIYSLPNVYDKVSQGKPRFCYFFPGYINRKGNYNKDGVSDVVASLLEILNNRYKVKYNSSDPNAIIKAIAEVPVTPQEAILRTSYSIFPTQDLIQRLAQLDNNPTSFNNVYTGDLIFNKDNKVEFYPSSREPIRDFPHKTNKIEGCWEIFEMPECDSTGKPPQGRYIASYDPYENDQAETQSLGSILILDTWNDRIVAERTGRTSSVDEMHEECRKGCLFYNAKCLYENNKKGCYAYFSKMNSLFLLADTPDYLKDKQLIRVQGIGNSSKGVNASKAINEYAKTLIRNWLVKPIDIVETIEGEENITTIYNLYRIYNRALLRELSIHNSDGNFDRVSSLGMLMLYREEKMILTQGNPRFNEEEYNRDYLGNDKFFNTNYKQSNKNLII